MKRIYQKDEQSICGPFLEYYNSLSNKSISIEKLQEDEDILPDCLCTEGYAIDTIIIYPKQKDESIQKTPSMSNQLFKKEEETPSKNIKTYILLINGLHLSLATFSHYERYFKDHMDNSKYQEVWIQSFKPGTVEAQYVKLHPLSSSSRRSIIPKGIFSSTQISKYPMIMSIPIVVYFLYIYQQHVGTTDYMSLLSMASLGIHEIGHPVFGIFGNELLGVMGGTLMQLLVPILFIVGFFYKKDHFLAGLGISWLGVNFFYMAMYAGDAMKLQLPMLSLGGGNAESIIHDRNYMFSHRGVIQHTDQIAGVFSMLGSFFMIGGIGYAAWLVFNGYIEKYH